MAKTPRFINFSELSEELRHFIQAGAKIFPIQTYEDLPTQKEKEFYRVLSGSHKNEIYAWSESDQRYELIGADDRDINWDDVKFKPQTFPPATHQHSVDDIDDMPTEMKPTPHRHDYSDLDNVPLEFNPTTHIHTEDDLIIDKYSTLEVDIMMDGKVDKVEGKGLSTNDFTNELLDKLESLTENAQLDYMGMQQELNNHKSSSDHDSRYYTKTEIANALANKADNSTVNGHINSSTIHVTQTDKDNWNGKADLSYVDEAVSGKADKSTVDGHIQNTTIHVTQTDKDNWNGKADLSYVDEVVSSITGIEVVTSIPTNPKAGQIFFLEV